MLANIVTITVKVPPVPSESGLMLKWEFQSSRFWGAQHILRAAPMESHQHWVLGWQFIYLSSLFLSWHIYLYCFFCLFCYFFLTLALILAQGFNPGLHIASCMSWAEAKRLLQHLRGQKSKSQLVKPSVSRHLCNPCLKHLEMQSLPLCLHGACTMFVMDIRAETEIGWVWGCWNQDLLGLEVLEPGSARTRICWVWRYWDSSGQHHRLWFTEPWPWPDPASVLYIEQTLQHCRIQTHNPWKDFVPSSACLDRICSARASSAVPGS